MFYIKKLIFLKEVKNLICIIQARMGSTRLPGKVLRKICGKPMLKLLVERVENAKLIDQVVIATTTKTEDDEIENVCKNNKIKYYRGQEDDVLDRYYNACRQNEVADDDGVVRVTGDCPLIDPEIIDRVISLYADKKVDYASNINPPTFPDGMDVEVIKFSSLKKAWEEANLKSEREHVTPYIRKHTDIFTHVNLENDIDLTKMRLTVDNQEDFEVIEFVFNRLYKDKGIFSINEVYSLMNKNSEMFKKNSFYQRNEGYLKSIQNDKEV